MARSKFLGVRKVCERFAGVDGNGFRSAWGRQGNAEADPAWPSLSMTFWSSVRMGISKRGGGFDDGDGQIAQQGTEFFPKSSRREGRPGP